MSAQNLKQLKIKTSMLKRLKKEYESYQKETVTISAKLQELEKDLSLGENVEEVEAALRKNRQFLGESQSVLSNVKQKLIEAFEGLAQFLSEKGEDQSIATAEEKGIAENLVLETETFLQNLE